MFIRKVLQGVYCLSVLGLIAYVADPKPTVPDCSTAWCDERVTFFFSISRSLSTKAIDFKAAGIVSHVINFGVLTALVPLVIICGLPLKKQKYWQLLGVYIMSVGCVGLIAALFKLEIPRQRPSVYFNMTNHTESATKSDRDDFSSFFSGDSALSAHAAMFFAMAPRNLGTPTKAFFMACAATGCVLRVIALMHWFSDVLTGVAVGILGAIISTALFENVFKELNDIIAIQL